MTFEADLRAHILGNATVAGLVADRVSPIVRPVDTLPAITYQRVAGVPMNDMAGDDGDMINVRVQVDCWARSHADVRTLSEAVRLRMQTAASTIRAVLQLDQDFYENETKIFRVMLDFSCWYRTS